MKPCHGDVLAKQAGPIPCHSAVPGHLSTSLHCSKPCEQGTPLWPSANHPEGGRRACTEALGPLLSLGLLICAILWGPWPLPIHPGGPGQWVQPTPLGGDEVPASQPTCLTPQLLTCLWAGVGDESCSPSHPFRASRPSLFTSPRLLCSTVRIIIF